MACFALTTVVLWVRYGRVSHFWSAPCSLVIAFAPASTCLFLPSCRPLVGTAVNNGRLEGKLDLTRSRTSALELLDDFHALLVGDLAKDNVLAIQPRSNDGGDEELGTVGVGTGIGHGQETGSGVSFLEVLIGELLAIDGLATGAIASSEVATLQHELRNDSVELAALVAEALLAGAESTEVLGGLGNYIVIEVEVDTSSLGRRDRAAGSLSIVSSFVESSVGVFDVEPGLDCHICGRTRERSNEQRSSRMSMRSLEKKVTRKRSGRGGFERVETEGHFEGNGRFRGGGPDSEKLLNTGGHGAGGATRDVDVLCSGREKDCRPRERSNASADEGEAGNGCTRNEVMRCVEIDAGMS